MTDDLYHTLREANFDAWESVQQAGALAVGQVPPRVAWLLQHIFDTKHSHWTLVAERLGTPGPPDDLDLNALMAWELSALAGLTSEQRQAGLTYAGRSFDVAALVRLNARHSVWHAGQIAGLSARLPA